MARAVLEGAAMNHRFLLPVLPLLIAAVPALAGCGADENCSKAAALGPEEREPGGMHGFASEAELEAHLAATKPKPGKCSDALVMNASPPAEAATAGASGNETITNNQEAGVDEGGIVKNVGDHLIVLRQGRLHAVDVADGRAPVLSDSIPVARPGLRSRVWYDEMLVKGDLIYVVGYRYGTNNGYADGIRGMTEVDTFRLESGKLTRLKSMFLESNDYYSGNYASRIVNGKLVFYMPFAIAWRGDKLAYPRLLTADDSGTFSVVGPIFGAFDVRTSLTKPHDPTFHTVVQCDLPDSGELECHGRSVIGGAWRELYVSPNAVYLWASSHVYRFDFDSLDVSTHTANGHPLDQFSFRETEDKLLVAVDSADRDQELAGQLGRPALLTLPLAAFDEKGEQSAASTALRDKGFLARNRFVGDVLVAAVGDERFSPVWKAQDLVTLDAATGTMQRKQTAGVLRLEPLGDRRILVVAATSAQRQQQLGVSLNAYSVDALGAPLSEIVLPGKWQGEHRSHSFFFRPDMTGGGTIGYAVLVPPDGTGYTTMNGISNLGFFDVTPAGAMSTLGTISAGRVKTECETSCVDWYGNTRPIFLRDRAFALMGSELTEITTRPEAKRLGEPVILSSNEESPTQ